MPPPTQGGSVSVALLLPLSGPSAALGRAMLDAAQMALYETADNHLQLLIRDTGGSPQTAAEGARSALGEGAQLVLGPLLASEVEAVKPVAQAAHVPLVAFSTSVQLAGGGTWLMGFDVRQEIQRIVRYAHAQGRDRFAVLAPRDAYGDMAVAALRDATAATGASLVRSGAYDPGSSSFGPAVQSFASGGIDYDALLLPEGGAKLRAIAPLLAYYKVDPDAVKFLGTGLWDDPGLGTEPSLEGGWYAAPAPAARADFARRFLDLYKHPPPRLATLGYDAVALAAALVRGPNGADFSPAALTNPRGFAGLDGIFRLLPDGTVQRGLAVLEVRRGGPAIIDPAPQSFEEPAY